MNHRLAAVALGWLSAVNAHLLLCSPVATRAADPPVNQWVESKTLSGEIYHYSRPVYVPTRKALCQWNMPGDKVHWIDVADQSWRRQTPENAAAGLRQIMEQFVKQKKYHWRVEHLLVKSDYQSVMAAGLWDSRRRQVVFNLNQLMVAYDPEAKKWRNLKAKSVINDRQYAGAPPVFGAGACYDPVNDEIVMFPHWTYHSRGQHHAPKNYDRRDVDGRISNHLGTLRYSFRDNTWRRVSHTFGSPEMKSARKAILAAMAPASDAFDAAYALRRDHGLKKASEVVDLLKMSAQALAAVKSPRPEAVGGLNSAAENLHAAAKAASANKWSQVLDSVSAGLWTLNEDVIDGALRVEPPPRCAAPMV